MNNAYPCGARTVRVPRLKSLYRKVVETILVSATAWIGSVSADPVPPHGIIAANIGVEQLGFENPPENVVVTNAYTIGDFRVRSSANKGDYDVQIGEVLSDDVEGGVLITSISENGGRDNVDQFGTPDPIYSGINSATSHTDYSRTGANAGGYFIPVAMTYPNSAGTTVVEYNLNVAAAWFPYDRWLGAFVRNSGGTNGGVNELITGTTGLQLGTHFVDQGGGRSKVDLTTLGIHSQTDGVLLVTGAKNEDNYALSQANADGTWSVFSKDNGTDGTSLEQDPIAFVYIPRTNALVVSGRFRGDGSIAVAGGNFTVTTAEEGRWELKIPGYSPRNGILIISPEGGEPLNRDNIVSYEANEARDGWIIESRDLPNSVPPGETLPILETPGTEAVASFVFIPGATSGFTVSPTNNVFTTENGGTGTFSVNLDTQPDADVTISVTSGNAAEGTVSPSILTFTSADWNVPQIVIVTGQDDSLVDGPVSFEILLSAATSTDTNYNGLNPADVTVVNLDNDGAFTVNPTGGLVVTEAGGTATFSMRLERAPSAPVAIGLSVNRALEGTVSPASITFTPDNWSQEQTVTIAGLDDSIDDGDIAFSIITSAAISDDRFFNAKKPSDVSVTNIDDDTAKIRVEPTTGLAVLESGGTATYAIVLESQPTADVLISPIVSDNTEVAANPPSLTFTAGDWNVPQMVTLTGVDDLVTDGNIESTITNSVASQDTGYSALAAANVSVTTLDNEATITLPTEGIIYGLGMPAIGVAGRVSIVDSNTPAYGSATLRVALVTNAAPEDRLEIRASGDISIVDSKVLFADTEVGTFAGGVASSPLEIRLNTNATPATVEALLRAITFRTAPEAATALRSLTITLADADGGVSTASTTIRVGMLRRADFQEGADHGYGIYTGAADTELYELQADTPKPTGRGASGLFIDWRDPDSPNAGQVLLRFDNLVGNAPGQVPTNAIVVSAELFLDVNDSGDGSPLYRMMVPWDAENETWNTAGSGITPDDVRARSTFDSQIGVENGTGATTIGNVWVSVTPDVKAWVSGGEPNYGWILPAWPLNLDGTGFSSSEAPTIGDRPRLRVLWLPQDAATEATFRQGVNNYTGAVDTRIRQNAPDTEFSTTTTVFVDALVSAGDPNPEQVLVRFDNIIGTETGQIPAGKRVEAAILDIPSVNGDAMGDGGLIYALLQAWDPLSTWNTWVDGIQTNGVEAATDPSATAGYPELNPDVQGGFLSFDLTSDVQAWVSGSRTNAGWVFIPWPGGGNGWGFTTSESVEERNRPRLRVYYSDNRVEAPAVVLETPFWNNGSLQLRFTGSSGGTYDVFRSTLVTGPWSKIGTANTDSGGVGTYTESAPPSGGAFYRVAHQ